MEANQEEENISNLKILSIRNTLGSTTHRYQQIWPTVTADGKRHNRLPVWLRQTLKEGDLVRIKIGYTVKNPYSKIGVIVSEELSEFAIVTHTCDQYCSQVCLPVPGYYYKVSATPEESQVICVQRNYLTLLRRSNCEQRYGRFYLGQITTTQYIQQLLESPISEEHKQEAFEAQEIEYITENIPYTRSNSNIAYTQYEEETQHHILDRFFPST